MQIFSEKEDTKLFRELIILNDETGFLEKHYPALLHLYIKLANIHRTKIMKELEKLAEEMEKLQSSKNNSVKKS
jgi:hypothetical protein